MLNKRVLLIGNNNGLPGVKVDIKNFINFFQSEKGGFWIENEIITLLNPSKHELLLKIRELKNLNLDFLIVYFSGHGSQRREVEISINEKDETITESDLKNISRKQLTIFDCCRAVASSDNLNDYLKEKIHLSEQLSKTRIIYENRIKDAFAQQVVLYSCSKGEYSYDTEEGGLYSKNLISAANQLHSRYILVIEAHQLAKKLTTSKEPKQNPDYIMPKLQPDNQLILGITMTERNYFLKK